MEIDPVIRDLGASAKALRQQESYSCTHNSHHLKYTNMGLLVMFVLVLILASQTSLLWPAIISSILAITVRTPFSNNKEKRSK